MAAGDDKIQTAANRATALTALAAGEQKAADDCLSSEALAALVARNLASEERQHCFDHLACCQSCYDQWRALAMDDGADSGKIIKGPWFGIRSISFTTAGSLLAAAACILLYLNIAPPPARESQAPVPLVIEKESLSEIVSADLRLSEEMSAPTDSLQVDSRPESAFLEEYKAEKKESGAKREMVPPAPAKNKSMVTQSMSSAAIGDGEKIAEADFSFLDEENELMVDIGNVIPLVLKKMAQFGEGEVLVLQTLKRERSLTLTHLAAGRVLIREEGFAQQEFEVDSAGLKKALKLLLEKEFPRSKKVRVSFGKSASH